jgi:hypothetical protein
MGRLCNISHTGTHLFGVFDDAHSETPRGSAPHIRQCWI